MKFLFVSTINYMQQNTTGLLWRTWCLGLSLTAELCDIYLNKKSFSCDSWHEIPCCEEFRVDWIFGFQDLPHDWSLTNCPKFRMGLGYIKVISVYSLGWNGWSLLIWLVRVTCDQLSAFSAAKLNAQKYHTV